MRGPCDPSRCPCSSCLAPQAYQYPNVVTSFNSKSAFNSSGFTTQCNPEAGGCCSSLSVWRCIFSRPSRACTSVIFSSLLGSLFSHAHASNGSWEIDPHIQQWIKTYVSNLYSCTRCATLLLPNPPHRELRNVKGERQFISPLVKRVLILQGGPKVTGGSLIVQPVHIRTWLSWFGRGDSKFSSAKGNLAVAFLGEAPYLLPAWLCQGDIVNRSSWKTLTTRFELPFFPFFLLFLKKIPLLSVH